MPVVGLADRPIEALVVDMDDPSRAAPAGVRCGKPPVHEPREEVPRLLAEHDARERRVLPWETHAGVAHHERQEGCLSGREAVRGHSGVTGVWRHRSTFSAVWGSNGVPPRRVRPVPNRLAPL